MVFQRERDERPPLSCILPHLYLGAEADVTQDILSARGISYVLSVSRCSPQPTFVPKSQYLRIPIDDSLRDDLLPWIPQALRFIDGAMSSGCSVLVHCAAGISRSPALAVAYIMYHLGMDLDHAYRFVKERRPSISPNFNFLGQLQLFQGTLTSKSADALHMTENTVEAPDSFQPFPSRGPTDGLGPAALPTKHQGTSTSTPVHQQLALSRDEAVAHKGQTQPEATEVTLSLSNRLKSLTLSLQPIEVGGPLEAKQRPPKPTTLHIPSSSATLSEKRKRLSLALTPASGSPHAGERGTPDCGNRTGGLLQDGSGSTKPHHKGETAAPRRARKSQRQSLDDKEKTRKTSKSQHSNSQRSCSRSARRGDAEQSQERASSTLGDKDMKQRTNKQQQREPELKRSKSLNTNRVPTARMNGSQQRKPLSAAMEAIDQLNGDTGLISPFSLTVNKLLDWGEKMLLGVLFGPRIKVGQPALPYKC